MTLKAVKTEPNFGRIFFTATILFIILLVISLYFFKSFIFPQITTQITAQTTTTATAVTTSTRPSEEQKVGTVLVAVKDKPRRVDVVGTLNELLITFTKVEVHFVGENAGENAEENVGEKGGANTSANTSGEWMTVFEGSKRVDLLTLTDINGILGETALPIGKYTQTRLTIEDIAFNVTNTLLNVRNKRYPATVVNISDVPSGELRFIQPFNVTEGKTTALIIDFDVERSVTRTASGYMLKPVVKIMPEILESGQRLANSVNI